MTREQLELHLDRSPFQPFRVRLKDGRSYDIRHRSMHLLAEGVFIIGLPAPDDPDSPFYDRQVWVPLSSLDGIDPLPETASQAAP